ncbi:MAG TPA: hypothetical protein VFF77_08350 [Holophagaceae bacterium]|jgi:hypothetical protein|nr:hypothetical protein [Holophagaceae bacterium]
MAKREPLQPSPKLQSLLREFQQIATMSGFLNHGFDPPQLRMQFTLYGRVRAASEAEGIALMPRLQAWSEQLGERMREESSSAVLPPQIMASPPQVFPAGGFVVVSTLTFTTKITDQSYFKVKTALLAAYQEAVRLREEGFKD